MQDVLASQQATLHSIARALDNFKKVGRANLTPAKIRSRIANLQASWSESKQNHAVLLKLVTEEQRDTIKYFKTGQFDAHEEIYLSTMDYMNDCLEELVPVVSR